VPRVEFVGSPGDLNSFRQSRKKTVEGSIRGTKFQFILREIGILAIHLFGLKIIICEHIEGNFFQDMQNTFRITKKA